jgi:nucleoside-diphosphate-sugar epimerase
MSNGKLALVTGGSGFIGRSLVDGLLARGCRVRVIARRPVVKWRVTPAIDHIRADISEPGVLEAAVNDVDEIYHLAAATSGTPDYYQRVTVEGSERLLMVVAANGGGRVVFVSSASVYDAGSMTRDGMIDEDFPLERNPAARGLYARTKTESELRAHAFLNHPTVKLTIVRPGLVYGPRSKNVLNGVALSLRNRLLITTGTPAKLLPLIYIDDLVAILIRIALSETAIGRIYNIAHPEMPTIEQFLKTYRELSGDRRPTIDIPLPKLLPIFPALDKISSSLGRRSNYAYTAARLASSPIFSADKIRREMGFEPQVGFREGLEKICSK